MDWEAQLKLQAYLDGELPEAERPQMDAALAQGGQSSLLLAELRQTREVLAGFEKGIQMPESREFFWSKIEREIRRQESPARVPAPVSWAARLRRLLVPASTVALLAIAGFLTIRNDGSSLLPGGTEMETALTDTGAFTYRDYSAGTTLVWLSYPAENEPDDDEDAVTLQ
ncbi:MAG: zf-HC2 domain-containing protein [Verrucomicrobiota bacterium]